MIPESITTEPIGYQAAAAFVAFVALYAYLRRPAWVFGPQASFLNGDLHKL